MLLVVVTLLITGDERTVQRAERGKQRRGAGALVIGEGILYLSVFGWSEYTP